METHEWSSAQVIPDKLLGLAHDPIRPDQVLLNGNVFLLDGKCGRSSGEGQDTPILGWKFMVPFLLDLSVVDVIMKGTPGLIRQGTRPLLRHSRLLANYATPEGTTLSRQKELKAFPVAPLGESLSKYLQTIPQFLSQDEWTQSQRVVAEFGQPGGVGSTLQKLLESKAQTTDNWFADWWLDYAYLGFRGSVVVWSNPGIIWPEQRFHNDNDQLLYAAKVIDGLLDFKLLLDKQCFPVECMGKSPMDMEQYYQIFGTCRMPGPQKDLLSFNGNSKHIVVISDNNFYKVSVYDSQGVTLSQEQLFGCLVHCSKDSRERGTGEPVGVLSSDDRDSWYKAYDKLQSGNQDTLKAIETSLFVLCLDKAADPEKSFADRKTQAAAQAIHGLGPNENAANRWFDKTMQVFISSDGLSGICYEHSTAEAVALMTISDHALRCANGGSKFGPTSKGDQFDFPQFLPFVGTERVSDNLKQAHNNLLSLSDDLEVRSLHFKGFGKSFVKKQRFSPDSFIQMAYQYAFYRIHQVPGGHYESGGLRIFRRGRTDIIRSCSKESVAFAQIMLDNSQSSTKKYQAIETALKSHNTFAKMTAAGQAFDRHLLGLKMVAQENGVEVPEFFKDPGFTRSLYHRLSTSQVSGKSESFVCFGPLVMDGYGCCYNIRDYDFLIGLSAMKSCPETNVSTFHDVLEECLNHMHDICVATQKTRL
eukprot:maker-scaffold795_size96016-snap-gene-0.24 protein:Tk10617 transcript:maker-scaffold795_size96016-snap-gene-0.24-mRNA-1 annotation:"carnitine o-acetyltransferase isoform x2"